MANKTWLGLFFVGAAVVALLWAIPVEAQQARVIQVPFARGVYYEAPSGWVALPSSVFMPLLDGGLQELLSVGPRGVVTQMAGPHAAVSINNPKPTFYLRGYQAGSRPYLVRGTQKEDSRELHMTRSRNMREWAHFRAQDLTDLEIAPVAEDLVTIRPRTDLKPGEYVIVSSVQPGFRAIRLASEFGVRGGSTP